MIELEAFLLTLALLILFISSYTDCREGLIYNKYLKIVLIPAIVANICYYIIYAENYLGLAGINFAVLVIVSASFYLLHIWAGGDSKLLLFLGFCIPGRLYSLQTTGQLTALFIIVFAFIVVFCWIILHGLYFSISNHDIFNVEWRRIPYMRILSSYAMMIGIIQLADTLIRPYIQIYMEQTPLLVVAGYCLMVLGLISLRDRLATSWLIIIGMISWSAILCMSLFNDIVINVAWSWRLLLLFIVIGMMLLRLVLEKYVYQVIPTQSVKTGDILAAVTVYQFSKSRVQGLPTGMTEDLRSRLTEQEAQSVRRWEKSKYGCAEITIVRKIPFAIFLTVGFLMFLFFEVFSL